VRCSSGKKEKRRRRCPAKCRLTVG
jgi:hypothetical protein